MTVLSPRAFHRHHQAQAWIRGHLRVDSDPDPAAAADRVRRLLQARLAVAVDCESRAARTAKDPAATLVALARACARLDRPEPTPPPAQPAPGTKDHESRTQEVDCRDLLLTPPEQLAPALVPLRTTLEECKDDPARFNTEVLGRSLWAKQAEVCNAVARSPVTVVPAGRAVGKSFLLAGLVLWWLYTRPGSLVLITGPDHRQVVSVLYKEIRRALRRRPESELDDDDQTGPRLRLGYDHLSTGYSSPQRLTVRHGTDWGALGFAAQCEEGFSGQHAGELLVIVDEASGIAPEIWSAIHGLAATRLVVAGNPIRYDCRFRELHELAQRGSENITSVPISTLESPHAALEHSPVGMAARPFLRQMREIHGDQSPWWRSNILGEFPAEDSIRFIPLAWLDACTRDNLCGEDAWRQCDPGATYMGIDVAGGVGADRSVIVVRNRRQILEIFSSEWYGVFDDARHRLEPLVLNLAKKWQVPAEYIVYDKSGPGRSFGNYLTAHGLDGALGYFGAGKGGKYYVNRRTANAFALKRRLDPHQKHFVPFFCGGLEHWPALRQELAELRAPTMEVEEGQVKQVLEDKFTLSQRLKRSPDLLDALLMTFTFLD